MGKEDKGSVGEVGMKTIWKYPIGYSGQTFRIPLAQGWSFSFFHVAKIGFGLYLWCVVDTDRNDMFKVTVRIIGTGESIPSENLTHVATIFDDGYVWHVFVEVTADGEE